eukprot:3400316-Alexandrium_andersonii.AAC.1
MTWNRRFARAGAHLVEAMCYCLNTGPRTPQAVANYKGGFASAAVLDERSPPDVQVYFVSASSELVAAGPRN